MNSMQHDGEKDENDRRKDWLEQLMAQARRLGGKVTFLLVVDDHNKPKAWRCVFRSPAFRVERTGTTVEEAGLQLALACMEEGR